MLLALTLGASGAAVAQTPQPETVRIWPQAVPGAESWSGPEVTRPVSLPGVGSFQIVTNVTTPTLTVFRPDPGKANGTAVIVCPGGGFQVLAWDMEGTEVAQWLADRGVTAFVLKYRVRSSGPPAFGQNARDPAAFEAQFRSSEAPRRIAIADGAQAIRFLRANAARFAIKPDRIGMMGFSAGAMTTLGVVLDAEPASRPDFAASIYGVSEDAPPPKDAPPLFIAAAQDDTTVPVERSLMMFQKWRDSNLPAELHVYTHGGHGFAMRRHDATADAWPSAFEVWLKAQGWIDGGAARK